MPPPSADTGAALFKQPFTEQFCPLGYCERCSNLGHADVFEVPALETEQFRAGYLVLLEGVAVHGEADGLQPLRHLVRTPLYDDLKQATKQLIDDKK